MASQVARRLPPSYDLDDLRQIARIETWRRLQSYDPSLGVSMTTYAYRAVRGACLMAARRRHYRDATALPLDAQTQPASHDRTEQRMQQRQMRKLLGSIMHELEDEREREVLYMHHWRHMDVQAIAAHMGVSASLVRMIRQQAYESMRRRLAMRGISVANGSWQ
jgi:RNA polymerase sigma factor (sigma-70 family)